MRFTSSVLGALRQPLPKGFKRHPFVAKVAMDMVSWVVGISVATQFRFALANTAVQQAQFIRAVTLAVAGQTVFGLVTGLYRGRWRYGSFEELSAVAKVTALAGCVAATGEALSAQRNPLSATVIGGTFALVGMAAGRYAYRSVVAMLRRPNGAEVVRLLVFGAGDRGARITEDLLMERNGRYLPVALIDDDPTKRRLAVKGVRVAGGCNDIVGIAQRFGASALLVAVTEVSHELMNSILAAADACEPPLQVKVLAPLNGLFGGPASSSIADLSEEDLLGRRRIDTHVMEIANYIANKRVLVTGAGGSIGSELCRQLHAFSPAALYMLDRDESALHAIELSIEGTATLQSDRLVLADLRDRDRIFEIMHTIQPDVVFHAAALKHLSLLEANPAEAVKSNIWGTQSLLEAARAVGVERFVNISTDKAADPSSVLGYSKRLAERLTAHTAQLVQRSRNIGGQPCDQNSSPGVFVSVRFGNVLGSRGSVLTTFRDQIARGHDVTVTHPDVTRYFMLVGEAVQLVIQAGAIGRQGEVLILDMGEPKRIIDVAEALIKRARSDVSVTITGLRPGEKLHEQLLGKDEVDSRPLHPLITHAIVPPLDPDEAYLLDVMATPDRLVEELRELCAFQLRSEHYSDCEPIIDLRSAVKGVNHVTHH
jgi:FlaA1/EpsC-like NDP-sugar epimerase